MGVNISDKKVISVCVLHDDLYRCLGRVLINDARLQVSHKLA